MHVSASPQQYASPLRNAAQARLRMSKRLSEGSSRRYETILSLRTVFTSALSWVKVDAIAKKSRRALRAMVLVRNALLLCCYVSQCVGGSAATGDSDNESIASEATHFTLADDLESVAGEGLYASSATK